VAGCGYPANHSGAHRLAEHWAPREDPSKKGGSMRQDILIATSMMLASVTVLLGIIGGVARAVRERES
jgi:hypothetical protein